ncbi:unnamed protein product [Acanthosepion pharaonis]|uniref:Uncharacterized protein n=1 Tax=Acanthosepion pharaonis TaxID=158019 RepID=A0A812DE49_ACAPH|nr:unnamed protein product [Sepia pharaonis]
MVGSRERQETCWWKDRKKIVPSLFCCLSFFFSLSFSVFLLHHFCSLSLSSRLFSFFLSFFLTYLFPLFFVVFFSLCFPFFLSFFLIPFIPLFLLSSLIIFFLSFFLSASPSFNLSIYLSIYLSITHLFYSNLLFYLLQVAYARVSSQYIGYSPCIVHCSNGSSITIPTADVVIFYITIISSVLSWLQYAKATLGIILPCKFMGATTLKRTIAMTLMTARI